MRNPDYILVVKEENLPLIDSYLSNLKALGFTFEHVKGMSISRLFVKVYVSDDALRHFSEVYNIGNRDPSVTPIFYTQPVYSTNPFKPPIDETVPFLKNEIIEADKISIINKVLENTKYGPKDKEFGLTKLIKLKYIDTGYALHDGPVSDDGTNCRSLLYRYWSNSSVTHMRQPLDLIYRYLGTEVAFYFAWLEYFNYMLIIPGVLGALTFLVSLLLLIFGDPIEVKEICESRLPVCASCEGTSGCGFKGLFRFCSLAQWTYVFDNNISVAYAVFISFWATLFGVLWRRKENILRFRWNCIEDLRELEIRQAYLEKATKKRVNVHTGEIEPYTPRIFGFLHYTVTLISCLVLLGILLVFVLANMAFKVVFSRMCDASNSAYLKTNSKILTMTFGSLNVAIIMKLFKYIYKPASMKLTLIENPRTQYDFDNSLMYKKFLMASLNCYIPQLYLAYFKGQFITMPHDMTFLRKDACQPCSCILALCIQLAFLMTLRTLAGNLWTLFFPKVKKCLKFIFCCHGKKDTHSDEPLPQWEQDYSLEPLTRYSVTDEFSEMVLRFGDITFFSRAFPLGALCTLLNNIIELRSDAYKFVKTHRRVVPVEKAGIGAWQGILLIMSYISTAFNVFIIAFTSDWVAREVYKQNEGKGTLEGFVNSTLSKYATTDYDGYQQIEKKVDFCYFRGYYHPPEHPNRYERTQRYWLLLTFKLITVFVFEHFIFLGICIFTYCIPYKPESVQLQIDVMNHKEKTNQIVECEKKLEQKAGSKFSLTENLHGFKD